jgi:ribonuclease HI
VQQKRLLELKAPNWKEWAFTDESWNKENGPQSIGAGVYPPQSNKITTVNRGGTSVKIINRAELAGVVAALINEHTQLQQTALVHYGK